MSKKELIANVADELGFTQKDVNSVVSLFFDKLAAEIAALPEGEKSSIPGFGYWVVKNAPARVARNPKTGEKVNVPASKKLKFRVASELKNMVAGK